MLFLAGITSSISIAQPAVSFMSDEFKMPRPKAVKIFAAIAFILCQPALWFIHKGVLGEIDFWGASVFIVLGATVEAILIAWVFGIDKAWDELHKGASVRIPIVFKYVIKYITPTFLIFILGYWFITDWWDVITMKAVEAENLPYILGIRLVLLAILIFLGIMVYKAWQNRAKEEKNA